MHPVQTANRNYYRRDVTALRWPRRETAERCRPPIGFAECGVTARPPSVLLTASVVGGRPRTGNVSPNASCLPSYFGVIGIYHTLQESYSFLQPFSALVTHDATPKRRERTRQIALGYRYPMGRMARRLTIVA